MATEKAAGIRIHIADRALAKVRSLQWPILLLGTAGAFAAGSPVATGGGLVLGIGLTLFAVAHLARTESSHCAFCEKMQKDLKCLVSAPGAGVSICEDCAPLAVGVTAERDTSGWTQLADALPKHSPWNVSQAFVDALVAHDPTPKGARHAAAIATRCENMFAAESALSTIPEAERTDVDWLALGVAIGKQGRYDEALRMTSRVKSDECVPWVKNNVAWFSVRKVVGTSYRASGVLSRETAEQLLRDLDDARATLLEAKPTGWKHVAHRCLGTRAEILRGTGALDEAVAALDRAQAEGPLDGEQLLCRARVLAMRGSKADALVDVKSAIAALHPESNEAEEALTFRANLERASEPSPPPP